MTGEGPLARLLCAAGGPGSLRKWIGGRSDCRHCSQHTQHALPSASPVGPGQPGASRRSSKGSPSCAGHRHVSAGYHPVMSFPPCAPPTPSSPRLLSKFAVDGRGRRSALLGAPCAPRPPARRTWRDCRQSGRPAAIALAASFDGRFPLGEGAREQGRTAGASGGGLPVHAPRPPAACRPGAPAPIAPPPIIPKWRLKTSCLLAGLQAAALCGCTS